MMFGSVLMALWLVIQKFPNLVLLDIPTPTYLQGSQVLYKNKTKQNKAKQTEWEQRETL